MDHEERQQAFKAFTAKIKASPLSRKLRVYWARIARPRPVVARMMRRIRVRRSSARRVTSSSGVGAEDDGEPPSTDLPAAHSLMRRGRFCVRGPPLARR